jgi:hypothetical protein
MRKFVLTIALTFLAACSTSSENTVPVATPTPDRGETQFVNPGGKWMPHQLAQGANAANLKKLGAELDLAQLADPTGPYLGAVVSLEFCSGSFVSPDGLVVTNYHCAKSCLQQNSTLEVNLMEEGFVAKDRADERPCQPGQKIFVTQEVKDVTSTILGGLETVADAKARYEEIEKRQKALIKECEATKLRCELKSFFEGAEFYLIKKMELKDIRLVYAPHKSVGKFGGDTDNWEWPRQTGDFSFFRAYVDENGVAKPYKKDEVHVPYKNKYHLKLASSPLKQGDLVLLAGYPGTTNRLKVGGELEEYINWTLPRNLKLLPRWIDALKELSKADPKLKIKLASLLASLDNTNKYNAGAYGSLKTGGFANQRFELEKQLQAWIDANAERKAKWGEVIPKITNHFTEYRKTRDADSAFANIAIRRPDLVRVANLLVKNAEERQKPDDQREPGYQERNWENIEASLQAGAEDYSRLADTTTYEMFLKWVLEEVAPENQPKAALAAIFGTETPKVEDIAGAVKALYDGTKLDSIDTQLELFRTATPEQLAKSEDTIIQLAVKFAPLIKVYDERTKSYEGKAYEGGMASLRPNYVAAMRAFFESKGLLVAPDANSTLRVAYGTVKGYRKKPDAPTYYPFTTIDQIITKFETLAPTNEEEFGLTPGFRKAVADKRFGSYGTLEGDKMPVCFLTDLDSTGGNSGSPTLNGKGELVGLLFDGTMEGLGRDWVWNPELGSAIHVDARYMQWVMDAVDGADETLKEMGVTPTLSSEPRATTVPPAVAPAAQ